MQAINPRLSTALDLKGEARLILMRGRLRERFLLAKKLLQPCESKYRIVWEDPFDLDAPAFITNPDPNWMACALFGYILPPVEVHLALKHDEAQPGFKEHHRLRLLDTTPTLDPMTEEQAVEYLIKKDLPNHVWNGSYRGNRQILKIVEAQALPTDRTFRDAWRVSQGEAV